jgi:hypothetical protein
MTRDAVIHMKYLFARGAYMFSFTRTVFWLRASKRYFHLNYFNAAMGMATAFLECPCGCSRSIFYSFFKSGCGVISRWSMALVRIVVFFSACAKQAIF